MVNDINKMPQFDLSQESELKALKDAAKAYEEEFKCEIEVIAAENSREPKAKQSMPGKAAILVE